MPIFEPGPLLGSQNTQYQISRSLRFRQGGGNNAYLSRTPASAGNRQTWTWSAWVKRGTISIGFPTLFSGGTTVSDTGFLGIWFGTDDTLRIGGSATNFITTSQVFRDPSAWYHIVVAFDTTQSTAANKIRVYVNGAQVSNFSTDNRAAMTGNYGANQAALHEIGYQSAAVGLNYFDGYLAEYNFIDGYPTVSGTTYNATTWAALNVATLFGAYDATTGVWGPKQYTGTYGTNGFYLNFSDNSGATSTTIGKDSSGNSNNWTPANISVASGTTYDSMLDSPTNYADGGNGRGNYCVWNPVNKNATVAVTDGNLSANSGASAATHRMVFSSQGFTTPSYFEITTSGGTTSMVSIVGVGQNTTGTADGVYVGSYSKSFGLGYAIHVGGWYVNGATNANGAATNLVDGTWGFAVDPANGKAWVRNTAGGWIGGGDPAAGTLPTFTWTSDGLPWFPIMSFYNVATTFVGILNSGQRSYAFTAPSGFLALNTQNLPTPTIANGAQYMAATLYNGNNSVQPISNSANNTIGTTFQPDFVWLKSRSSAYSNYLFDVVRGSASGLISNSTAAQDTGFSGQSFDPNGFTVSTFNTSAVNASGSTYVMWQWKAGGTGVSNTSGSIPSTVSANQSAGFSVVTYTGTGANATVGHGLGVAPNLMLVKNRNGANAWDIYSSVLGAGKYLDFTTAASVTNAVLFPTTPTSTLFYVGAAGGQNTNGASHIAYCWTAIPGYSAFGSYTGNGSADGPFVFTNFRPRFVMIKSTTLVQPWNIFDTSRDPYNVEGQYLQANNSIAEGTFATLDVTSNGFKLRTSGTFANSLGDVLIYAAFAENPLKFSRAR